MSSTRMQYTQEIQWAESKKFIQSFLDSFSPKLFLMMTTDKQKMAVSHFFWEWKAIVKEATEEKHQAIEESFWKTMIDRDISMFQRIQIYSCMPTQ